MMKSPAIIVVSTLRACLQSKPFIFGTSTCPLSESGTPALAATLPHSRTASGDFKGDQGSTADADSIV